MSYPIDVVHLDRAGTVIVVRTLPPWRLGPCVWRGVSVVELAAGEAARLGLERGAQVDLEFVEEH